MAFFATRLAYSFVPAARHSYLGGGLLSNVPFGQRSPTADGSLDGCVLGWVAMTQLKQYRTIQRSSSNLRNTTFLLPKYSQQISRAWKKPNTLEKPHEGIVRRNPPLVFAAPTRGYAAIASGVIARHEIRQSRSNCRSIVIPAAHPTSSDLMGRRKPPIWRKVLIRLVLVVGITSALFIVVPPFRYAMIGLVRCTRVALGVFGAILDYKKLFSKKFTDNEEGRIQRHLDYHATHLSAASRILEVLKRNGGIYVKLGQHISSIQLIPIAWSQTMRPLQDQCLATPYALIDKLFLDDVGVGIKELFDEFDPQPIGVASLAQVHRARDRQTGREVAVKVMHPSLEEYLEVDMRTVMITLKFVKWVFPEFEFTWLGEVCFMNFIYFQS